MAVKHTRLSRACLVFVCPFYVSATRKRANSLDLWECNNCPLQGAGSNRFQIKAPTVRLKWALWELNKGPSRPASWNSCAPICRKTTYRSDYSPYHFDLVISKQEMDTEQLKLHPLWANTSCLCDFIKGCQVSQELQRNWYNKTAFQVDRPAMGH